MIKFKITRDDQGKIKHIETPLTGQELLEAPKLNKGSAFSREERKIFSLNGKLPYSEENLEEQLKRRYLQYKDKKENIEKNIFLNSLHDTNETLFFKLLADHLEEMMPIIYTPTEAEAIQNYSSEVRRMRGLHICYEERDNISEILENRLNNDIDLIVVTDGEQILGIGDQGAGGISISVAKLAVYTICAGINPHRVLPIVLDVGTNNEKLLQDDMYLGWNHKRIKGQEYYDFVDQFVTAVKSKFPGVYLHWEDFGRDNARWLLEHYQNDLCTFNDDMQGTGAVTLSTILAATKALKQPLTEQRIVIFGSGTAGVGIADQIVDGMVRSGLSKDQACSNIWLVDKPGLLTTDIEDTVYFQKPYLRDVNEIKEWKLKQHPGLLEVVQHVKPTILIGCSTCKNAFTEEVIKAVYANNKHPIILPLSNPISKCEANPADIMKWTEGNALAATGSPFPPTSIKGKVIEIAECNNCFFYPGLGLGCIAVKAKHVTSSMIWAGIIALSEYAPILSDRDAPLLAGLGEVREVSYQVAMAVAKQAIAEGEAEEVDIDKAINLAQWEPKYYPYKLM